MGRVAALFDNVAQADPAVAELRAAGLKDDQLSLVMRHDEGDIKTVAGEDIKETAADVGGGALAGAGIGSILGVAVALVPGLLPFAAAGTIASALGSAIVGGGAIGAAVGGAAGALTGALAKAGFEQEEAEYYAREIERGNVLIGVDTSDVSADTARDILSRHGGRTYHAQGSDALRPATD